MTPPLTDAELLAYIERTPEFTDNCWVEDALENGAPDDPQTELARNIARAFHAAEQRVREEQIEACAKLIEQRGELYVSKWMNADDMETQAKAYAWESRQHAIAIRNLAKQGGK